MSDGKANVRVLADVLADPEIREIWEQELWETYADPVIRRRFEQETGLDQKAAPADPLHGFSKAAECENRAYAFAFAQWFNDRCWGGE